jgi:predicted secreted protein
MKKALAMAFLVMSAGTTMMAQVLPAYFDEASSGRTVTVAVDSIIELRLAENPATAHMWKADNLDARFFKIVSDDFDLEQGVRVFKVKCLRMGGGDAKFIYIRPWEGDLNPAKTFKITLDVTRH